MTDVRFLLDVNVGTTVARFLRTGGFDVLLVSEIDPRMPDEAILALAVEQHRVLITIDKDFGDLIFHKSLPHKGVIRLEDCKPQLQIRYLNTVFKKHMDEVPNGIIVAERGTIRVRTKAQRRL